MSSKVLTFLTRGLKTSSILRQMVKTPIPVTGIEGRYAAALYSAASKEGKLDAVEEELTKLQEALKSDAALKEFILNPTMQRKQKVEMMKVLAEKLSLGPLSTNLLKLLAENARLKKLDAVIGSYHMVMSAHRGEVKCEIISAKELDSEHLQQLKEVLKSFVKGSETVQVTTTVNPNIIGGLIVTIGDRFVDLSVSRKVHHYVELMHEMI